MHVKRKTFMSYFMSLTDCAFILTVQNSFGCGRCVAGNTPPRLHKVNCVQSVYIYFSL